MSTGDAGVLKLGRLFHLDLSATPSALLTYVALTGVLAAVAMKRYRLSPSRSVAAGLLGASLHAASVLVHHCGHATAAGCVGHPMTGIRFWGGLATSGYSSDEPPLPARVHLIRASGGPLVSVLLAVAVAAIGSRMTRREGLAAGLGQLVFVDNLCVLGLGSLLPLGFTDGSTLLKWRPGARRGANRQAHRIA